LAEGKSARPRLRPVPSLAGPGRRGAPAEAEPTLRLAPPDPEPGLARIPRIWLVVAALIAALAYAGLHTAFFMVRQIRVAGLVQLTQSDVAEAADVLPGTYLWQVRPWTLARRLARLPLLKSVHVRLLWPDTIALAVIERQPVALLDVGESADLEVDAAGRVIALAAPPGHPGSGALLPAPHVPVVRGVTAAVGAQPGQRLNDPALADAIAVAQGLGAQGQALLGSLSVDAQGEVTADLASGVSVGFGDGSHARQKTEVLLGLLKVIAARGMRVDSIDLASPTAPSVHVVPPSTTPVLAGATSSPSPQPAQPGGTGAATGASAATSPATASATSPATAAATSPATAAATAAATSPATASATSSATAAATARRTQSQRSSTKSSP
jgi:cell division protein FtsQ